MNKIKMTSFERLENLDSSKNWDICFVGNACDERGKAIKEYLTPRCAKILSVIYDPSGGGTLKMDDAVATFRHIQIAVSQAKTVLVESTTLGVTEILFLLKKLLEIPSIELELIYLEPYEYTENKNKNLLNSREFSLGNNNQYAGVKKFSCDLQLYSSGDAVFLLGFEGARLAQALEQNSLQAWQKHAVFGVPSFEAGWEMNAFANNINHIASEKFTSIRFSGASNILDTLMQLEEIHKSKNNDEPTIIIPIGTKPMSIAAAIFLCMESKCQDSGILFDHPVKNYNRTLEIRCCHLYSGFKIASDPSVN
jgi:hypothetical protein